MKIHRFVLLSGLVAGWAFAGPALAASPRQIGRPNPGPGGMVMPNLTPPSPLGPRVGPFNPGQQHMPGWDWQRTYPWSPYNYGRNPYNPAYPPMYPPYYPQPYQPTYPSGSQPYYQPTSPSLPDGSMVPSTQGPEVLLPHPTGQLRAAPPDAGVIEVRIPDAFGTVLFDGAKTSSTGTTRYYVTPSLPGGKPHTYTISATWTSDGKPGSGTKTVQVTAGHFSVADFNPPPPPAK